MTIEVVDYIRYEDGEGMEENLSTFGGMFENGMRWEDYQATWKDSAYPHLFALRKSIIELEIRHGGDWHQREGCPVYSDGSVTRMSMRAWGDLLAAIWSTEDNKDYNYMDFYM